MRRGSLWAVVVAVAWVSMAEPAQAVLTAYVGNPAGNSVDWEAGVLALGGGDPTRTTINRNVDFEGLSTSTNLYSFTGTDYYLATDGVRMSIASSRPTFYGGAHHLQSGAGPSGGNTTSGPRSTGEGVHPSSKYLLLAAPRSTGSTTTADIRLTVSFAEPVAGAGLDIIDLFNPYTPGRGEVYLEAFSEADGAGTSLGRFDSVNYNFQRNNRYFMGVLSTGNDIGSVVLTLQNYGIWAFSNTTDRIGVDDLRVARATPAPVVPEPATVLGVGVALAALGVQVSRRRRRG